MIKYSMSKSSDGATFWADLGPFISSRAVQKELGGPIFNDDRYEWVIAKDEDVVVGWAAIIIDADKSILDWAYVVSEYRKQGIYAEMRKLLIARASGMTVRGTSRNPATQNFYEREGFVKTGSSGAWNKYEKKAIAEKV